MWLIVDTNLLFVIEDNGVHTNLYLLILQAEKVFNQDLYFKKTVKYVGEPMTHLESIASSAVFFCCHCSFS